MNLDSHSQGEPGVIRTSHRLDDIEAYISNARFENVNF